MGHLSGGKGGETDSSFHPTQYPPMFAVTFAELRHTPWGHAGGPHVVVTFPPALVVSPRPHCASNGQGSFGRAGGNGEPGSHREALV